MMPVLNFLVLTLVMLQMLDLIKADNRLSKFVRIIYQGFTDAAGLAIIFIIFNIYCTLGFHVLCATMDDGDNYNTDEMDGYDTSHNDYPFVSYWVVSFMSAFRSSVGDL